MLFKDKKILNTIIDKEFIYKLNNIETPSYIYNLNITEEIIKQINNYIKDTSYIQLYYAVKANYNYEILEFLSKRVSGFDVASHHELSIIKKLNFDNISITGPGFDVDDIKLFLSENLPYDFNSLSQLYDCKEIVQNKKIGVRINIPYNNEKGEMIPSRFGINIDQEFIKFITDNNITISRLHFHNGEKNESFFELVKEKIKLLLNRGVLNELETINLGGGLMSILLDMRFKEFIDGIKNLKSKLFGNKNINFIIEPGNALVNISGFLVTKVINIEKDNSKNTQEIILNTSSYNLNHWFNPVVFSTTSKSTNKKHSNLYGITCYEYDYFAKGIEIKSLKKGDKVTFYPVGAYSKSNHTSLHGLPFPNEYYYHNQKFIYQDKKI
ncbi:MAG: hypothetical protein ACO1OT_19045 [Heyndrickxia sp.]